MTDEKTTSVAKELGSEYQADSLAQTETITHNFRDMADPTYSDQLEAMVQSDTEKASSTDDSSNMSVDLSLTEHDNARSDEKAVNGSESLADEWKERGGEAFLDELDEEAKFDIDHQNTSDYNNEM